MNTDTHNPDRRKALNLPPMPVNDNHRREESADYTKGEEMLVMIALGVVIGMALVMAYHLIY